MIQISRQLASLTSVRHSQEVGGAPQIATIVSGEAVVTEPFYYHPEYDDSEPPVLSYSEGVKWVGPDAGVTIPKQSRQRGLLIDRNVFDHVEHQALDNLLILRSTFSDCTLTYHGSPAFYFDKSNKVDNCKLIIDNQVPIDSPGLAKLVREFPDISIWRANGERVH